MRLPLQGTGAILRARAPIAANLPQSAAQPALQRVLDAIIETVGIRGGSKPHVTRHAYGVWRRLRAGVCARIMGFDCVQFIALNSTIFRAIRAQTSARHEVRWQQREAIS
jgi:hypothetical protein